jgi:hypothetical protein
MPSLRDIEATEQTGSAPTDRRSGRRSAAIALFLLVALNVYAPPGAVAAGSGSGVAAGAAASAGPVEMAVPGLPTGTITVTSAAAEAPATTGAPSRTHPDELTSVRAVGNDPVEPDAASTSPKIWKFDLYDSRAERYQDPDKTACTAASALSMLNTIYYDGSSQAMKWQPTTSVIVEKLILGYERSNMTMLARSAGSDPHGWRNALNYFGWGSARAGVYADSAYSSLDAAARATVSAIARYGKPVGILAFAGGHAQFVTGYRVSGDDPRSGSTHFTVLGIYLTDPLRSKGHRDTWISYADWARGGTWVRFSPYLQSDSPYRDPIDGKIGTREWYGKWVIVNPVR